MDNIILLALKEEAPALAARPDVFFTGVGKVNAAIVAAQLIERYKPTQVINFGTAGGITVVSGLHQVTRFVQRDMNCSALGFAVGQTPYETELALGTGLTCSSGDSFVDNPVLNVPADLVDMEAYAIAKACHLANTKFLCYKFISDTADHNASTEWVTMISAGEKYYIEKLKQLQII
jgi:adenosylhomocysteine nucleosidase